ncbi:lytic transglycosylase domain-containing protein [Ostreibacterium oceani]|nr:lytic transglycosylase domain-containing protein [Ostreibacterium oceani]
MSPFFSQASEFEVNNYLSAKAAIAAGADIRAIESLTAHPLYPYLAADFYRQNLTRDADITALFTTHFDAPPVRRLHDTWILRQFDLGNFDTIVKHYYDTGDQAANCAYRSALHQLGNHKDALVDIDKIWLSPRSISHYCDTIFGAWEQTNQPDYILKRARLAYHEGNTAFAQTMADKLPEQAPIFSRFIGFLNAPTTLLNYTPEQLTATPLHRDLLPSALEKLVRIDSVKYTPFATQFATQFSDNNNYQAMLSKLTLFLVNRHNSQALTTYALMTQPDEDATEAITRYLVINRQWDKLRQLTENSPKTNLVNYWRGRAFAALGDDKNAKAHYQLIANKRDYYSFLAADKLNQPYEFNHEPIKPVAELQTDLSRNQSLIRAKAFTENGDHTNATREILDIASKLAPPMARQLAYWLNQHSYHHEAIIVLGRMRDWNDTDVRFPRPYDSLVDAASQLTGVDANWIYAIIRQESSMNPRAVSSAQAQGLMQLIPGTARQMATAYNITLNSQDIFNPSINTQLGAAYLKSMHNRFNHLVLATAAYNAGPARVEQWVSFDTSDITIWIEAIPFNETRKYVKRVLEYKQTYAQLRQTTLPSVSELINLSAN